MNPVFAHLLYTILPSTDCRMIPGSGKVLGNHKILGRGGGVLVTHASQDCPRVEEDTWESKDRYIVGGSSHPSQEYPTVGKSTWDSRDTW